MSTESNKRISQNSNVKLVQSKYYPNPAVVISQQLTKDTFQPSEHHIAKRFSKSTYI